MPIYQLPDAIRFPDPRLAEPSGLLAVGGDLSPARVLEAYRIGIFPWFSGDQPILWWSPDPRMVLYTEDLHVGRSLRKRIRKQEYRVTMDQAFAQVIDNCATKERPDQSGTWITSTMRSAYLELHHRGHAHSVETWRGEELIGGLYGVAVGKAFAGESMFAHASDASKVAFVALVRQLHDWGYPLIDCQMHTAHLERFGALEIPRAEFLRQLRKSTARPGQLGRWSLDRTQT